MNEQTAVASVQTILHRKSPPLSKYNETLRLDTSLFQSHIVIILTNIWRRMYTTQSTDTSIFKPIPQSIISLINNDPLCLQSTFWVNNNKNEEVQVLMTNHYIALCEKGFFQNVFHYYVQLCFDLKFKIVYQGDTTTSPNTSSPPSKKIGFKLHLQGAASIQFTICNENLIELWIQYLSKNLNQLGFHQTYKPIKKLGKGGFATVYQVQRQTDKKHFAVKAFSKQNTINSQNPSHRLNLLNEISIMRHFDNPNIIKLEGVYESDNSLYVVLQLLSFGQLHTRINKRQGKFSQNEIRQFMTGMGKALVDIHSHRIMHRDIKPQNIMLRNDNSLEPVIIDFGLAANVDANDYLFYRCGTPGYVAPEITTLEKGQKVEPSCDVFSTGVIFHILLTKRALFEGRKFEQVYDNNRKMRFNLTLPSYSAINPQAMDLLQKMLKINPEERISAIEMLKHPYLSEWVMQQQQVDKDICYHEPTQSILKLST